MATKPPKPTKGGPIPDRKNYPKGKAGDTAWQKDLTTWNNLNPKGSTSTKPTPKPTPKPSATPTPTPQPTNTGFTPKPVVPVAGVDPATPADYTWDSFTDGTFNIQEGDANVGMTPYVTATIGPKDTPTPVVILPSADGTSFTVIPRENLLQILISQIQSSPNNAAYWKTQLQNYYRSQTAFQTSLRGGPVTDKDTEFVFALRRALGEISANNFSIGAQNVANGIKNTSGFYDINSWISSRTPVPGRQSQSTSTRNFTLKADAIAEFMREVQLQVGDPKLVDNVKALAEAYFDKVRSEEERRMGQSTSVYDPVTGITINKSTGFEMPSAELLKEWRIQFITKGALDKNGKTISLGIRNATGAQLQDAGGLIGDTYTKLKGYAFDYGVRLTDDQLKAKAAESLLPGGSVDEQRRTIQLASRALYKSLAPYIEGGLKVSDIANQFMKTKIEELELSDGAIDIFDTDVQAALTADKLPSQIDYLMAVRSDPKWRFTKKANESAAGFVDTILKTWGFVG